MLKALEDGKAALYLTKSCVDSCVVKESGKRQGRRGGVYYGMDKAAAMELLSQDLSLVVSNSTKPSFLNKESTNVGVDTLPYWPTQTDFLTVIETDRDVIVPKEKTELLRVLAHYAELPLDYGSAEVGQYMLNVKQSILTILAKVDFTLLERGEDMMDLCKIVHLNYYNRSTDLKLCGEPSSLINYYIGKLIKKKEDSVPSWVADFTEYMNERYGIPLLQGVMAYHDITPFNYLGNIDQETKNEFIRKCTELKEPDWYQDMGRVYEEINREIKKRRDNEHELKIYLIGILSPFAALSSLLFKDMPTDQKNIYAVRTLINVAPVFRYYSDPAFKAIWDKTVNKVSGLGIKTNRAFFAKVEECLIKKYKEPQPPHFAIENMYRMYQYLFHFQDFESSIEAALLEIGANHDYHYYEHLAGVSLGETVSNHSIYNVTEWTAASALSMAKDLKHSIKESNPPFGYEIAYDGQYYGVSPIYEEPPSSDLSKELLTAKEYLDVLHDNELVDSNYKWTGKKGNQYAAWASKIIINNCPDVRHPMVGQLFGIKNIGSYVTDAKNTLAVKTYINNLFENKGLSIVVK